VTFFPINKHECAHIHENTLNRRAALLALGGLALARPGLAQDLPDWMTTPGDGDTPYGQPATDEAGVVRALAPESPGFEIWHTPLEQLHGTLTPNGLHFAVHHAGIPDIDPARHALLLHGRVGRPLRFSLERLLRYPMVSRQIALECAGNSGVNAVSPWARDLTLGAISGQVSGAEWTGVPLRLLLDEAGVDPDAGWAVAEGADAGNHARSLPVVKLRDDAMVALFQNGERLRPSQGWPMRLILPGWEGNTQIKWLHRIELVDAPVWTKDESGLYADPLADGGLRAMSFVMEVKSAITRPSGRMVLDGPGFHEITGLAWSGRGRIERVDVSTDGGLSWTEARLHGPRLPMAMHRFSVPWVWDGRPAVLASRATDEAGQVQPTRAAWHARFASHAFNHYNAIQAWQVARNGAVSNAYL
jgi:sulfane dehydrogenase subunit SoxC